MKKVLVAALIAATILPTAAFAHGREYREHHHYRGHGRGAEIAIGIGAAAAIIGLGIAAESSRRHRREYCYYDNVYFTDRYGTRHIRQELVCD